MKQESGGFVGVDRRRFLASSSLALAGTALARVPLIGQAPAQPAPPVETIFREIRDGVGVFTARGGAIGYYVSPDAGVAVDAQFPDTAEICLRGLQARAPGGVQLLINTHYHGDHVGGNAVFRPAVKSIVQQERCAKLHRDMTTKAGTQAQQAFADLTFGESWSQQIGKEKVWGFYHGAGHTGGDAVIVFERANVVHMGDLMFNRMHPRVDRPGGASIKSWINVLERVAKKHADATFIFGHAKPGLPITGNAKDLLGLRDYLSAALAHAQKGIRAKQSQEAIVKVDALPGFTDYASSGTVLTLAGTLTAAYEELGGK
jgi:cyclase